MRARRCHKAYGWSIDGPALGPRSRRGTVGCLVGSACIRERMIDREAHRAETHCKFDGCRAVGIGSLRHGGEVEPGPITSFEDIAGIYKRGPGHFPVYMQFSEDGTLNWSLNPDLVEDRPTGVMETRFEGTKVFLNEIKGTCDDDPDSTYEIHLLENGNLQFVEIEDTCAIRSSSLTVEWAPVP